MLTKRIIPCFDVDNGRVVKGVSFVELRDAGDPVELAKLYDAQGADELVFLDMTMPGLTGLEALGQMRKARPHLKALVASGYPLEIADANFLAKPYSPLDLVRRIQEVLNSTDEPAGEGKLV